MEGNRDEAERCIDIAFIAINSAKYEKAEKFLRKAQNLYPTERATELLKHVNKKCKSKETRSCNQNIDPAGADLNYSNDYTIEQLEIIQKIKKCKDYYEILNVSKEATDSEIKKAYKKLALQLHPDKNHAPGAAEAFKAVGNAAAILTDSQKRKEYDMYGLPNSEQNSTIPTFRQSNSFHVPRNNYEYDRRFESDISAEELFNMFFGGFPQRGTRFRHQHESSQQPSLAFGIILVLIIISMLSSFFTSDPLYTLSPTSKYPMQRKTSHLGISYYVKENFAEEYEGSMARLENSVEEDYVHTMKQNCYRERSYRESMIARARSFGTRFQLAQAQALKTPSCDNLANIGLSRYSLY